jgi:hypothetical protein
MKGLAVLIKQCSLLGKAFGMPDISTCARLGSPTHTRRFAGEEAKRFREEKLLGGGSFGAGALTGPISLTTLDSSEFGNADRV